jgi:long-chain fatty acid transport protein
MMKNALPKKLLLLLGLSGFFCCQQTFAALTFSNASGLGNVYAGEAAIAEDASTLFYNPAGLSELKRPQLLVADLGVYGFLRFNGTTNLLFPPYTQNGTAISHVYAQLPSLFYSYPINCRLSLAFGATPILGYAISNFPNSSIVRYIGTKSKVAIFDITPGFSYVVNDKLSVGAGLDFEYLMTEFQVETQLLGLPGSTPDQNSDSKATGTGYGAHAGVLYKLNPKTRLGLTYHTIVSFRPSGTSQFGIKGGSVNTVYTTNHYRARFPNPPVTSLSVVYDLNPQTTLMGTIDYIEWSRITSLTSYNTALPPAFGSLTNFSLPTHYSNEWQFLGGVNYQLNCAWLLRAGIGYGTRYSTNNIPDPLYGAATGLIGIGGKYIASKALSFDFGLMDVFLFQNEPVHFNGATSTENGNHYFDLALAGAQMTYNF